MAQLLVWSFLGVCFRVFRCFVEVFWWALVLVVWLVFLNRKEKCPAVFICVFAVKFIELIIPFNLGSSGHTSVS